MAYGYGGYPGGAPGFYQQPAQGYYQPGAPMPDQLAQLRAQGQMQQQAQMMAQPAVNMPTMQPPAQSQSNGGIVWVSCEREAAEYPVAPNCAVSMWDSNAPVVYMKQADATGKPTLDIYDLVKRSQQPVQAPQAANVDYVTRADFNALAARCEALAARNDTLAAELATLKSGSSRRAAAREAMKEGE